MKRYYWMMSLFILCLIVAGCRRSGGGVPRRPVPVEIERDILPAKNERERHFIIRPNDRKYKVWSKNPYLEDKKGVAKSFWADVIKDQEEAEKNKDMEQQVAAAKAQADAAEAAVEFEEFSKIALKYLELKKANPRDFDKDEFYKYVRRERFVFNRKWLDKVDVEIFHEEVPLYRYLESSSMVFVPEVDMDNRAKNQGYIIAHREAAGGGGGAGGMMMGGGPAGAQSQKLYYANVDKATVQKIDGTTLTSMLMDQDLRLMRMYYLTYAATFFMRPASDQNEIALWNLKPPLWKYEDYIREIPYYPDPAGLYKQVEDRVPSVMKNPPEPGDLSKFKLLLKEKAPPSMLTKMEDGVLGVNTTVNLRNGNDIVTCLYEIEWQEIKDMPKKMKGHRCITTNGQIFYQFPDQVKRWLPVVVPKQNNLMNMMPPK